MQPFTQISFRGIEPTGGVLRSIEKHVERLGRFFPRIVKCQVILTAPPGHHRKGNPYQVSVGVSVPGKHLVVKPHSITTGSHLSIQEAIADTFNATTRQLRDYVRRRRGEVKRHASRFRKSQGEPDDGMEIAAF